MPLQAGYMVPHPPIAVPEIGWGEEEKIRATLDSFEKVACDIAALKPETIVITSPHQVMYRDYFHISPGKSAVGSFAAFNAPQVSFRTDYDEEFVLRLTERCEELSFPAGTLGERDRRLDHGTMVPLYFINKYYRDYKLVRIGLSGLPLSDHVMFGRLIRRVIEDTGRKTVFIASGDLSHCQKSGGPYGYRPEGPEYDEKIMDVMGRADFHSLTGFDEKLLDASMECGHRSFVIMGGAFGDDRLEPSVLSHEATFGVGYGFVMYHPAG